jgi:predicted nuclease of predicted toxin-antitoxin system
MLRFVADENFNNKIVRGLRYRLPLIDLVRVQDVGLIGADDPTGLEWAASEERIVLTHDVTTMIAHVRDRVAIGLSTSGIVIVRRDLSIGSAIEDICLLAEVGEPEEFNNPVLYLPLS